VFDNGILDGIKVNTYPIFTVWLAQKILSLFELSSPDVTGTPRSFLTDFSRGSDFMRIRTRLGERRRPKRGERRDVHGGVVRQSSSETQGHFCDTMDIPYL